MNEFLVVTLEEFRARRMFAERALARVPAHRSFKPVSPSKLPYRGGLPGVRQPEPRPGARGLE
jgi:hypothetical protein